MKNAQLYRMFLRQRVRFVRLLALMQWKVESTKSPDAATFAVAFQHCRGIRHQVVSGWPAPAFDVATASSVLARGCFNLPLSIISGATATSDNEMITSSDVGTSGKEERYMHRCLDAGLRLRFLEACGLGGNGGTSMLNDSITSIRRILHIVDVDAGTLILRRRGEFEMRLWMAARTKQDGHLTAPFWIVSSLRFLIASALSEGIPAVCPTDTQIGSLRTFFTQRLAASADNVVEPPMTSCIRRLHQMSTQFIIATLRTQAEECVQSTSWSFGRMVIDDDVTAALDGAFVVTLASRAHLVRGERSSHIKLFVRSTKTPNLDKPSVLLFARFGEESNTIDLDVDSSSISMRDLLFEVLRRAAVLVLSDLHARLSKCLDSATPAAVAEMNTTDWPSIVVGRSTDEDVDKLHLTVNGRTGMIEVRSIRRVDQPLPRYEKLINRSFSDVPGDAQNTSPLLQFTRLLHQEIS